MRTEPIIKFTSEDEARKCLKWWQEKMQLTDWIIHLSIIPASEAPLNGENMGMSETDHVNNCGMIYLADQDTLGNFVCKKIDEKVLVHELLHFKYPTIVDETSYTSAYMDIEEHRKLEKLAKSLLMVKYDLTFDYFDNKGE